MRVSHTDSSRTDTGNVTAPSRDSKSTISFFSILKLLSAGNNPHPYKYFLTVFRLTSRASAARMRF